MIMLRTFPSDRNLAKSPSYVIAVQFIEKMITKWLCNICIALHDAAHFTEWVGGASESVNCAST